MKLSEHVEFYMDQGMDKKAAMKQTAADRGITRRDVYQALIDAERNH